MREVGGELGGNKKDMKYTTSALMSAVSSLVGSMAGIKGSGSTPEFGLLRLGVLNQTSHTRSRGAWAIDMGLT